MRVSLAFALALLAISASARPASPRHTSNTSQPLILQADDGKHLVRRSGPAGGWPYLIKLDPQQGRTQDFFVMAEVMAPGQSIPGADHKGLLRPEFLPVNPVASSRGTCTDRL